MKKLTKKESYFLGAAMQQFTSKSASSQGEMLHLWRNLKDSLSAVCPEINLI